VSAEVKHRTGFAGPMFSLSAGVFNADYFFRFFCRKASERCQASFADASS
jgi:hypothetical protein